MFTLDVLNSMINEHGGAERLLTAASEKFGVDQSELRVLSPKSRFYCEEFGEPSQVREALEVNHEVFGIQDKSIYALSIISKTGMLLGARDGFNRLVGLAEFIYDRQDSFLVSSLCIRSGFEGRSIGRMLIREGVKRHPNRIFWVTVGEESVQSTRLYLKAGFKAVDALPDYLGNGVNHILLRRKPGEEIKSGGVPYKKAFSSRLSCFRMGEEGLGELSERVGDGFIVSAAVDDDSGWSIIFEKSRPDFGLGRIDFETSGSCPGLAWIGLSESFDDAVAVSRLDESVFGETICGPQNLFKISKTGLLIIGKDGGGGILFGMPVLFDVDNGVYCPGAAVHPSLDEAACRRHVYSLVEDYALGAGKERVWITTTNPKVYLSAMNEGGFTGGDVLLNYYGEGVHRIYLEKTPGVKPKRFGGESPPILHDLQDLDEFVGGFRVGCEKFYVLKEVFARGFKAVKYQDNPIDGGSGYFVLIKDE